MIKNSSELHKDVIKLFESDDGYLFEPPKKITPPTSEDRLIESFHQITDFVEKNDRMPDINSEDIGEATLASRLESIKFNKDKSDMLKPVDRLGLLVLPESPKTLEDLFQKDDYQLFSSVGNEVLKVRDTLKKKLSKAESVERRKKAKDFENFRPGFLKMQEGLASGEYKLTRFRSSKDLKVGQYYIALGMMVFVASKGISKKISGSKKARLRCIFENGTESYMYDRSLAIDLYEDGYLVVPKVYKDKSETLSSKDKIRGYIYILKSKNSAPEIVSLKDLHKIGFSTTSVEKRIKNAHKEPTYLMAPVDLIASYAITNDYNPQKIEYFIHRIFADAAVDLRIVDKYGREYKTLEWYSVPLKVIDQAINLLKDGSIINYIYDSQKQKFIYIED